jgi:hypothetical protein
MRVWFRCAVDVNKLAQLAAQLVARVREDDPTANQRWLYLLTTPEEREALLYVLAAAVPTDQPWSHLTAWTRTSVSEDPAVIAERRRILNEALSPQFDRRGERGRWKAA